MKKLFALLLVAVMMLGLVACAQGGSNETQKPTEKPTEAPTTAPTTAPTEQPTEAPTQAPMEVQEVTTADELKAGMESVFGGSFKLANDITIDLVSAPIKIFYNVTLDLNGHVLTINQPFAGNVISIQGDYEPTTFIVTDTSAEANGVLRGVVTAEGAGTTLIRVNVIGGIPQHFILKAGTIEYVLGEGVSAPNSKIRIFNITHASSPSTATVEGGKVLSTIPGIQMYNVGSEKHGAKPTFSGGMSTLDPTQFVIEGSTVTTSEENGITWYTVSK